MEGAATPWILLRGLVREQRHWGAFATHFAQSMPEARVIALDLAGNGRLHGQPSSWTVDGMVECVRSQCQQLGVEGPVHVLAVSMGAMVASRWAHQYPQEVRAQVLVNTSMRPFSWPWQRLRPANYAPLLRLLLTPLLNPLLKPSLASSSDRPSQRHATALAWEQTILALTSNGAACDVLSQWVQYRTECPVSARNALRQLIAAARFKARRTAPHVPTLLLASTQDRLVDVQCSRALAQAWALPLQEHSWAGHDLTLDDGPWVVQRVQEWLNTRSA